LASTPDQWNAALQTLAGRPALAISVSARNS